MKIAGKYGRYVGVTPEMVEWFNKHYPEIGPDDLIHYHDQRLVECVRDLKPEGWFITDLPKDVKEYYAIATPHDFILITRGELEFMLNNLIKVEDVPEEKPDSGVQTDDGVAERAEPER